MISQNIIVAAIVLCAFVLTVRGIVKRYCSRGKDSGCSGCDCGCSGCDSHKNHPY
ncbi:MAG: FeoB-associated Cys-rich membrane protein [Rikenellaceae bacterium]